MSVLETLYVLFKGDASNLIKTSQQVDQSVKTLTRSVKTSVNDINRSFDTLSLKNFRRSITDITRSFRFSPLLKFTAASSLFFAAKQVTHFADSLDELSDSVGVSVESLSLWSDAVKIGGGDSETFQNTVRTMSGRLEEFAIKGKSRIAPFFDQLGVKMVDVNGKARNFIDTLPDIAEAFSKIPKSESLGIGVKMGLDEGTIMLLQKGRVEVDNIIRKQKELGVVSKKSAEEAGKFNDSWDNFKHVARSVFMEINTTALPIMRTFFEAISDFGVLLIQNKPLLAGFATALGIIVFSLSPLTSAFVIAAAAIGIYYEDIKRFRDGQSSLIGDIIKKYPNFAEVVKTSLTIATLPLRIFISFLKKLPEIFNEIKRIDEILGNSIKKVWNDILSSITESINYIMEKINKFIDFLGFSSKNSEVSIEFYKNIRETRKNSGNEELVNPFSIMEKARNSLSFASSVPLNNLSSSAISSLSNVSNSQSKNIDIRIGDINIQTQASDSGGIASEIKRHLNEQMNITVNHYDDGILI